MQILADLQSDFDFFLEWRGNVFGHDIFCRVFRSQRLEIDLFRDTKALASKYTAENVVYFEANALKSICSATPARAEVMPSAFRHSIRTVAAYRVGSGTGYDIMVGLLPRGKLPVSATLRVPSGFNFSFSYLTEDLESVFPVVA